MKEEIEDYNETELLKIIHEDFDYSEANMKVNRFKNFSFVREGEFQWFMNVIFIEFLLFKLRKSWVSNVSNGDDWIIFTLTVLMSKDRIKWWRHG